MLLCIQLLILIIVLSVVLLWQPSNLNRKLALAVLRISWLLIPQLIVIGVFVGLPLGRAFLDVNDTNKVLTLSVVSTVQAWFSYIYARWLIHSNEAELSNTPSRQSISFWGALLTAIISGSALSLVADGYAFLHPSRGEGRVSDSLFDASLVVILFPLLLLLFLYHFFLSGERSKSIDPQAKGQTGSVKRTVSSKDILSQIVAAMVVGGFISKLAWPFNSIAFLVFGFLVTVLIWHSSKPGPLPYLLVLLFVLFFLPGVSLKATIASAFLMLLCIYCHAVDADGNATPPDLVPLQPDVEQRSWPFWATILIAITSPLWLMISHVADYSGAVALLFTMQFWTALTVLFMVLCGYFDKGVRRSLIAYSLLLAFFMWQALGASRYHTRDVRLVESPKADGTNQPQIFEPESVSEFATDWFNVRKPLQETESFPVVLVASSGGGIRAAYWTSGLLAALENESIKRGKRPFSQHLLAISSVSGGSLGSSVFVSSLKAKVPDPFVKSNQFLARDFVGPIVGPMMIRDLFSSAFRYDDWWDRGIALETAFERAWGAENGTNSFETQLESLWADPDLRLPMLLLNSTDAESGTSLVKSNCALSDVKGLDSDRQRLLDQLPMRLSTACLLSARFPYASPEGRVSRSDSKIELRLVDGGYCDNSGNATLMALFDELENAAKVSGIKNVRFIVLSIENAPMSPRNQVYESGPGSPVRILSTIWQKQTAAMYTERIKMRVGEKNFFGNWRPQDVDWEYPLSWYQSTSTCKSMNTQITQMASDEKSEFNQVIDLLMPKDK